MCSICLYGGYDRKQFVNVVKNTNNAHFLWSENG